jgi:cytochrome c oxidase subunit 2
VGGDGTRAAFDALFSAYFVVTTAALVLIGIALTVAVLRGRRRGPRPGADPSRLEIAYVLLLVVAAAGLITVTLLTERNVDARSSTPDVRVRAVASQWRWSFAVSVSAGETSMQRDLVVPKGATVAVTLRSTDVIHSMWVPEVRFKRYAFPDRTTTFDLEFPDTGSFEGLCAQFCGLEHDTMRFTVHVLDRPAFDTWLAEHAS